MSHMVSAFLIAFLAGVVRGYSGFGYAVLVVLGLNLLMPAQQALVTAILLDLACCLGLLRQAALSCHTPLLKQLVLGMVAILPVGLILVNWLPSSLMSLIVGGVSLIGGVLLWLNRPIRPLSNRFAWVAGMTSGLAMTTASAGGPPLMVYLLNQPISARQQRSTAILFFAICSSCALVGLLVSGLFNKQIIEFAAIMFLPSLLGNQLGQRLFYRFGHLGFRQWVAPLLIMMSCWVIVSHW